MKNQNHKMGSWRYLLINGLLKKRRSENPTRNIIAMRRALKFLHMNYRELVMFRNPYFTGYKHDVESAPQWLDFCIWAKGHMVVVLFNSGNHEREKEQVRAKKRFLEYKKIKYAVFPKAVNYMEYVVRLNKLVQQRSKE